MKKVLDLTQQLEKKLETVKSVKGELGWLERLMVNLIGQCSQMIKSMAENQLDTLSEELKTDDVGIIRADEQSYLELKEADDSDPSHPSPPIRMNTIDSARCRVAVDVPGTSALGGCTMHCMDGSHQPRLLCVLAMDSGD
eukprot:scaffold43752_cov34-Prasinocladus_malaysianus.AAC.1